MKKIIFSALAAFCMISANAQNEVSVVPFQVDPGTAKCELEVALKNNFEVHVLTYEVKLPVGFHLLKNSKGKYVANTSYNYVDEGEIGWTGNPSVRVADGTEYLSVANACADDYVATQDELGTIMKWYLSVDAGVAPGIYPLDINCRLIGNEDKTVIMKDQHYTSYVVVGNGTGSLKLDNIIPSDVNAALATEAAVTAVDLSGATALNGTFSYVDSRNVVGTEATASVKYVGNKTGYYSVNVPFGGDVNGTGEVYELTSTTTQYAHFDKVTTVEANKTYLATGEVTIAANAKVASVAEQTNQTGNYVLDDTFYHGSNLTVPATRGLFEGASLSNLRVVVDGVLTNINVAQIEAAENAFDLQGRQTNNAKNGVFVVNGKKQFVK